MGLPSSETVSICLLKGTKGEVSPCCLPSTEMVLLMACPSTTRSSTYLEGVCDGWWGSGIPLKR